MESLSPYQEGGELHETEKQAINSKYADYGIVGITIYLLFKNVWAQLYTDFEIFYKNMTEAMDNYNLMLESIDLEKYGLSSEDVYSPSDLKQKLSAKITELGRVI